MAENAKARSPGDGGAGRDSKAHGQALGDSTTPQPNRAAILDALGVLFEPGDVVELRAFAKRRKQTDAGYFDGEHREALAEAAVRLNAQGAAVYVTLNPIDRQLLGRYSNRIECYAAATTTDANVTRRRWLLLDFDPVRPKDTAATDAQLAEAKERADACYQALKAEGWPAPVKGMSGNGYHLLYPIDLPNDDASSERVKGALAGLAERFDTKAVKLDRSVFNAGRITKLFGTVATKGDPTAAAPWRLSRLLETPPRGPVVSAEQLRAVAPVKEEPASPRPSGARQGEFNLADFLARLAIPYESDRHGGRDRYKLARCPFNPDHGNGEAAIFQQADGTLCFKCQHNGCADKHWQDVRALVDGPRGERYRAGATTAAFEPGDDWPEPMPLGVYNKPPAAFPVAALPRAMSRLVAEVAASVQVPPDLPGALALAALALAVGRRAEIHMGSGHVEPGNLYIVVAQPPGARKSSVFCEVTRPLAAWEAKRREQFAVDHEKWEARTFVAKAQLKALELRAKEGEDIVEDVAKQQRVIAEEPTKPTLFTANCTAEALVDLMASGDGVLGCLSAEGAQFFNGVGQYKAGANSDLDCLLEAHAGDAIRHHRVGKGERHVPHPCLTAGLTVQPAILQTVGANRDFRDRGLIARFLWSHPADLVGQRRYADDVPSISSEARADWKALLERVLALSPNREDSTAWRVTVSREALEVWRVFAQDVEYRQDEGGDLLHVRDFASKLAGAVGRIALGFHLAEGLPTERVRQAVGVETMENALRLGRYFLAHFLRVFRFMAEDFRTPKAARVIEWLREKAAEGEPRPIISVGDILKTSVAGIETAADAKDILEHLADEDWIREIAQGRQGLGRRPNPRFQVHPSVNYPVNPAKHPGNGGRQPVSPGLPGKTGKVRLKNADTEEPPPHLQSFSDTPEARGATSATRGEREGEKLASGTSGTWHRGGNGKNEEAPPLPPADGYLASVLADPEGDAVEEDNDPEAEDAQPWKGAL